MVWEPSQYMLFREARRRPFFELLARVQAPSPSLVVDLGCGTGDLTLVLAERWPQAQVLGLDNSDAMLQEASRQPAPEQVHFSKADLAHAQPPGPVDVLISNAALHWVEDHTALLTRLVGLLAPGATLAFQIPANFEAPSHLRVEEVRALPRFSPALAGMRPRKG